MTTLYLLPLSLIPQWFTNVGVMAAGGTVTTAIAGTTTPVTTYTDSTGLVANPNPMTLSSTGRPVSASGAPVAFWVPAGTVVKFLVNDASGNQLDYLDNVQAINDPSNSGSVLPSLANPASSGGSGVGPVAGVDLVANAIKSYDTFADVRAANQPVLASGQTLSIQVQGANTVNDGDGGDFYWSATSVATDNGNTVLKPSITTGAGRWLRLFTPPYGAIGIVASASTTDLGSFLGNFLQITGSTAITSFGSSASTSRALFFVTFAGILTLTYNATSLIIPGGQNITTASGDTAILQYLGSGNWQVLAYYQAATPASGIAAGSFTATLTGMTATTTFTCQYKISNGICSLSGPGAIGTSNLGSMTLTGLPAICQPATQSFSLLCEVQNSTANQLGLAAITALSGTIQFTTAQVSGSVVGLGLGAFGNSGIKGLPSFALTYSLA